jgi:hypothetical protein
VKIGIGDIDVRQWRFWEDTEVAKKKRRFWEKV